MTNRTRNLLLFVLLAGAALGTWMLARDPKTPVPMRAETAPPSRSFNLVDAVLYVTGDDGQIQYAIEVDQAEQTEDGDQLTLEGLHVRYLPGTGVDWDIRAALGVASENLGQLHLTEDVQVTFSGEADGEARVFETDDLMFDADEYRICTEAEVVMRKGSSIASGSGLCANLQTDSFTMGPGEAR